MKQVVILIGIIVVAGGLIFLSKTLQKPVSSLTTRELALKCDAEMTNGFHIHPVLQIVVNGANVQIPSGLGIQQNCLTALHTHSADGVLHIESPEKRDFTLGDFFAVWKQPFNKDKILNNTVDATHRIRVTVDGKDVDSFENTVLKDKEHIVISYEPI